MIFTNKKLIFVFPKKTLNLSATTTFQTHMGVAIHTINLIYHIIQRPIHLETYILTDIVWIQLKYKRKNILMGQ